MSNQAFIKKISEKQQLADALAKQIAQVETEIEKLIAFKESMSTDFAVISAELATWQEALSYVERGKPSKGTITRNRPLTDEWKKILRQLLESHPRPFDYGMALEAAHRAGKTDATKAQIKNQIKAYRKKGFVDTTDRDGWFNITEAGAKAADANLPENETASDAHASEAEQNRGETVGHGTPKSRPEGSSPSHSTLSDRPTAKSVYRDLDEEIPF